MEFATALVHDALRERRRDLYDGAMAKYPVQISGPWRQWQARYFGRNSGLTCEQISSRQMLISKQGFDLQKRITGGIHELLENQPVP